MILAHPDDHLNALLEAWREKNREHRFYLAHPYNVVREGQGGILITVT